MPQLKFTKSAIGALPTSTKDAVYWDRECPGFGIKVTPKGRKVFFVLYRIAGHRFAAAQIHNRPGRPGNAAPSAGDSAKGICCQTRRAGSSC
jgi:hypothetical protein